MPTVTTSTEVLESIRGVKARANDFSTNFFPVEAKLRDWINQRELELEPGPGAVFFLRRDRDFHHLYFSAINPESLEAELTANSFTRTHPVTADIVGKADSTAGVIKALENAGFRNYSQLQRLARIAGSSEEASASPEPTFAESSDADQILKLLDANFDRYADQLPMAYEINAAIERKQILVIRHQSSVTAFLHFETQGLSSLLRFWVVGADFRGRGFGGALMRHYFRSQSQVRRFSLWVNERNQNALKQYQRFGYAPDGLTDRVMVNSLIP